MRDWGGWGAFASGSRAQRSLALQLLLSHVVPDLSLQLVDAGHGHEGIDRQQIVIDLWE